MTPIIQILNTSEEIEAKLVSFTETLTNLTHDVMLSPTRFQLFRQKYAEVEEGAGRQGLLRVLTEWAVRFEIRFEGFPWGIDYDWYDMLDQWIFAQLCMSVESIQEAIGAYRDSDVQLQLNAAEALGYIRIISHTQAEWIDEAAIERARTDLKFPDYTT